jgi:hypothetical protein
MMSVEARSVRETPMLQALVERDLELGLLADLVHDVASGRGRLLLFEAPAGLGKSALLERGVRIAREAGLLVLRARGHQLERGFAWGLARSLFEASLLGSSRTERDRLLDSPAAPARSVFEFTVSAESNERTRLSLVRSWWGFVGRVGVGCVLGCRSPRCSRTALSGGLFGSARSWWRGSRRAPV